MIEDPGREIGKGRGEARQFEGGDIDGGVDR